MGNDDGDNPLSDNVVVLLIAMGSAAFVVSMYHVIAICLCHQNHPPEHHQHQPRRHAATAPPPPPSLDQSTSSSSVAHLIPTHKYHKRSKADVVSGDVGVGYEGGTGSTCAVCLGDFEEGEELKTLPECLHSFHVPCIDMWLYSHPSCPICRASATPSPAVSAHHHTIEMMTPVPLLQTGLVR